jgi:hypothetical protein
MGNGIHPIFILFITLRKDGSMKFDTHINKCLVSVVWGLFFVFIFVTFAHSSYQKLGNFYDDNWATKYGSGDGDNAYWIHYYNHPDSNSGQQYKLGGQNDLYIDGNQQTLSKKYEPSDGGWDTFENSVNYKYIVVKGGSDNSPNGYADLWEFGSGSGYDIVKNLIIDKDNTSGTAGVSHVIGFNPVPIPGTVWLLGAGMLGLIVSRRKNKDA